MKSIESSEANPTLIEMKDREITRLADEISRLKMELSMKKIEPRQNFSNMLLDMFDLDPDKFDLDKPYRIALYIRRAHDMSEARAECYRDLVRDFMKGER